jgi:NADPH2:quinone reductase
MTATMRAAWYETNGEAADVLQIGDMPMPEPKADEVRVRVHYSGVNPSDWKSRAGRTHAMAYPRIIPHSDGSGVIDAVGANVAASRIGERVWVWNGQWQRPWGTAADYICVPSKQAVVLPEGIALELGATLGIPALTAYHALSTDGGVVGKSVLVAGGAGVVGALALQMAKALGASTVITTVSSEAKAALAIGDGADMAIDYRREDVIARVAELTGGAGVDRVVEVDVAANMAILPAILARRGSAIVYGSSSAEVPLSIPGFTMREAALRFFIVYQLTQDARAKAKAFVNSALSDGTLRPRIAAILPLSDIVEAHQRVESGREVGSMILDLTTT